MEQVNCNSTAKIPWNKGKIVGQKAPFKLKDIWAIRIRLQLAERRRELALFNLAIDSKLRACDLVKLSGLPAAVARAHDAFGVGQVIGGDLMLAWKSFLRCAVAYGVTAVAIDFLPPIRWTNAFAITATALVIEVLAELAATAVWGVNVSTGVQLAVSAVAYSATVTISIGVIRRWSRRRFERSRV
jgi:hypothetical protein